MVVLPVELRLLQDGAEARLAKMGMEGLCPLVETLMSIVYVVSARHRWPEDGGRAHEWWTLSDLMEILEAAPEDPVFGSRSFTESEVRIILALVAFHDIVSIKKITQQAKRAATGDEKLKLERLSNEGRRRHMEGVREVAQVLLSLLTDKGRRIYSDEEVARVVEIGTKHDDRKVPVAGGSCGFPYPPTSDRAAVAFVEGDIIWPISGTLDAPLRTTSGPVADIRRRRAIAGDAAAAEYDPSDQEMRDQAQANLETQLRDIPDGWEPGPNGLYRGTLIRTVGGRRLLDRYMEMWNLQF